jgi:hypothetical protein
MHAKEKLEVHTLSIIVRSISFTLVRTHKFAELLYWDEMSARIELVHFHVCSLLS